NRADLLQRRGRYPAPPGAPSDIPGLEFAGRVAGHGPGCGRFPIGARVMGLLGGGGYAQRVVVDERHCLPVPDALSWEAAGALPEALLTAHDALIDQAGLRVGDSVLISAAASGIGLTAARLAVLAGARPIGLSRSEWKRARLPAAGFAAAFDPALPDLAA